MNRGKQLLLEAYYYGTTPMRWIDARRRKASASEPIQIVFYHRIANKHPNEWTMSCQRFTEQIDWLSARFDIVTLAEAQRRIESGSNTRPTAVITFDDGYADNSVFALPMLLRRRIPFTYFVTTDNIRKRLPFPHDAERGVPLEPNTVAQIKELASAGVEIGAHTRTHADLGQLTGEALRREIVGSKEELERITGEAVRYFAFPFGQFENMTDEGFAIAREAGFDGVCSAFGGYNFPGGESFHLQRFHADPEFVRFKTWFGVDPRKLRIAPSEEVVAEAIATPPAVPLTGVHSLANSPVGENV